MSRTEKMESLRDDLALLVDADRDALEKHADFLAEDDEARDLKHDAAEVATRLEGAGADYVVPTDLEARLMAALDARAASGEARAAEPTARKTDPGFVLDPHAKAELERAQAAARLEEKARLREQGTGVTSQAAASDADAREAGARSIPATVAIPQVDATSTVTSSTSGEARRETSESESREARRQTSKSGAHRTDAGRGEDTKRSGAPIAKVVFLFGALGLAAAAAVALAVVVPMMMGDEVASNGGSEGPAAVATATTGRIVEIARSSSDTASGIEIRAAGGAWESGTAASSIPAGASIRTDERTRVRVALSDGSELVLNHSTEVRFDAQQARRFELPAGEVLADVAHLAGGPNLGITVPTGRVEVLGTKFLLTATPETASVRVTRGTVRVHGSAGESREVKQGEEGLLRVGAAPEVAPVMELARSLAWTELDGRTPDVQDDEGDTTLPGIGSLRARRPGEREDRERPLGLARHEVRVRIVGNVARTEIEEVFRNDSDQVLEGIYRFPLPSDAQIARLALDVDGELVEGSFVARERAQRIWRGVIRNATPVHDRRPTEEFIWVPGPWRDPALLEWQRGGQFELRIFPIPAHGERRVVLAYTQVIAPQTEGRRYVYPLAHSRDDSTRVGEFSVDVRVANAQHVAASGYQLTSAAEADATRLRYTQQSFRPNGDLVIDYQLPGGERELSFWTYQGQAAQAPAERSRDTDREVIELQRTIAADDRPYVAFALRPRLPPRAEGRSHDYVIVVDSSQSMVGERFQRASRLVAGMVSEMDRRDRFTVLACDYQCRSMEGTAEGARMRTPSAGEVRTITDWLARVEPAGASDVMATMRSAARAGGTRDPQRSVHVIYVGDGVASVGHRAAGALASEAERLAEREHVAFTTVGIGSDADSVALAAIARSGGGHYVPFVPGQRASLAALSVLETTYGVALRDATLALPEGLTEIAPAQLPTIRAGEEVIVTARMARGAGSTSAGSAPEVQGDVVLRGTVGGQPFEQRYPVRLVPSTSAGNLFVPALWAAHTIEQLELEGRGTNEARVVALSKAYSVMSRETSLLVLESEAMFRAFGIDRTEQVAQWTGEEDVESGGAEGSMEVDDADPGALGVGGLGTIGSGRGAGFSAGGGSAGGGEARPQRRARASGGGMAADMAAPLEEAGERRQQVAQRDGARAESRADFDAAWQQPAAGPAAAAPIVPPRTSATATPRPRGPGQWMRRVYYRVGEIQSDGTPSFREQEAARLAEESLRQQSDSRDRHRAAVRALSRAGNLERALEVAEAWFARDRVDPDALVARADVLARLGRRDEALRLLTGVVDLRPDDAALQTRLAQAFDRAGDDARACAHRVSLAEIRNGEASIVADAVRCERAQGHRELADLVLGSVREESVRRRASTAAEEASATPAPRGQLMIEASWPGGDDVDVALIAPDGSRLSWMGGRTTIVGSDVHAAGRETLGLRSASVGQYLVEVTRTSPSAQDPVRGTLRIRVMGETRSIPFVLDDEERASVARVVVRRESRMEAVGGGW